VADPTVRAALGLGWRAAVRNAWLAPVGLVVAVARIALAAPVLAFAWFVASLAAVRGLGQDPRPLSVLIGVLDALTAPRTAAVLLGLSVSAALLAATARLAWLAGALPTLGRTLAGDEPAEPLFARGVAYGLPRLAATALLAWLLELAGAAFAWMVVAGSLAISVRARDLHAGIGTAAVVAAALACAVAVPLLFGAVADSALGRAALRGEDPARALGRAAMRVARRPAAFLLVGLAVAISGLLAAGTIQGFAGLATGFARGRVGWLLIGPDLVVAVVAALVAAWVELWRLGALATLACAED
jgi:hypothetical protein